MKRLGPNVQLPDRRLRTAVSETRHRGSNLKTSPYLRQLPGYDPLGKVAKTEEIYVLILSAIPRPSQPAPTAPNQVWVGRTRQGDITYLPKQGGDWLYLATWLDRYSRKVVGWDVRESMPEDLVSEALRRALSVRQPAAGLVVHSDQGSQYSATNFRALVARHEAVQSMSRRGNCYDNAHAESFWSRLKTELLAGGSFRDLSEARLEISHYLAYHNAERRHSALGYLAPNRFEIHFQTTSQLCAD